MTDKKSAPSLDCHQAGGLPGSSEFQLSGRSSLFPKECLKVKEYIDLVHCAGANWLAECLKVVGLFFLKSEYLEKLQG